MRICIGLTSASLGHRFSVSASSESWGRYDGASDSLDLPKPESSRLLRSGVTNHWSKLEIEIVKRSDQAKGFSLLAHRWIVERTFGWLMRHRRLVRDYERTTSIAEAWIHLAMIRIQLRRLA